jgi:hypothetical protein
VRKDVEIIGRLRRLEELVRRLADLVERALGATLVMEELQMAKIDDLIGKVGEQTTVVGGVGVLLDTLATDLKAVRDQLAQAGADTARLDEVLGSVSANTDILRAAVARNTSAEEPEAGDIHGLTT